MKRTGREEIRKALTGPVPSIFTPFRRDGSIDFPALQNFIEFCLAAGSKALILTYGDSLFSLLSDQEVADLTQAVVRYTAGRALVVTADRSWATPQTVEFAQYAKEVGADVLMVRPPCPPGVNSTIETFIGHYAAVAQHIPVMLVTNVFAGRPMSLSMEVLKTLRDTVENIVAIKDDICGEFARKMGLLVHEHWAIVSGGQKQNHLDALPYGCDGYLSSFIMFKPSVTHAYWNAIQAKDWAKAVHIINSYDMPFFDFVAQLPGGYDAGFHGTLELFGIMGRWRRKPYNSLSDADMERLAEFFKQKGLL